MKKQFFLANFRAVNTNLEVLGLDLHSNSPKPVNFLGPQSSLGGHNFRLGGHKQLFGGKRPRNAPLWRRAWATTKNKQCEKVVFPQNSNLQPLEYRSTALPLKLEKTSPRVLSFGYLNVASFKSHKFQSNQIKPLIIYLLYYAKACNEFAGPFSVSLRVGNTFPFE